MFLERKGHSDTHATRPWKTNEKKVILQDEELSPNPPSLCIRVSSLRWNAYRTWHTSDLAKSKRKRPVAEVAAGRRRNLVTGKHHVTKGTYIVARSSGGKWSRHDGFTTILNVIVGNNGGRLLIGWKEKVSISFSVDAAIVVLLYFPLLMWFFSFLLSSFIANELCDTRSFQQTSINVSLKFEFLIRTV